VKLLQVSDIHGSIRSTEVVGEKARDVGADLVLVVGDITNFGTVQEAEGILTIIEEGAGTPVLFVPGNCDPPQLLSYNPASEKIVNIHAKTHHLEGLVFIGIGGSLITPHRGTWIEFEEKEVERILSGVVKEGLSKWILVSHNPPAGVDAGRARAGLDLGSHVIRRLVERDKPLLVSCGHVHEARSISYIGDTAIVNAGPAKDGYCAVIDIRQDGVHPSLESL